jgi:hypothetical protein
MRQKFFRPYQTNVEKSYFTHCGKIRKETLEFDTLVIYGQIEGFYRYKEKKSIDYMKYFFI